MMHTFIKYIKSKILCIFIFCSFIYSQDQCDICAFNIDEIYFNEGIVGYYLGGFDLNTGDSDILLFEYLINGPASCYYNSSDDETLILEFNINIFSPSLGFSTPQSFVSGSMTLSDFTGPIRIRNTDINFSTTSVDGATLEVNDITPNISDAELQNMTSYIISTGKIPNGTYAFEFKLKSDGNEDCTYIDTYFRNVEIYEPTFLELLSPGFSALSDANESPSYSLYPVFTWNTDMCSACEYGIRVSEFDQSKHSSFLEALNDFSSLPSNQSLDFYSISSNTSVLQYPSSGAFDLELGNYYVWQLRRSYSTTVGSKEDFSDIFIFKISSFDSQATSQLDFLIDLIGEDEYLNLFGPGGQLEGFSLSGIKKDGENISSDQIQEIIMNLQQGNLELESFSVE